MGEKRARDVKFPNWENPHAEATFEQDLPYQRMRKLLNPFVAQPEARETQ